MNELQTYEALIRQKSTGKALLPRVFLIALYTLWVTLWLALLFRFHFRIGLIVLGPLTTLPLILITWKYVQLEYEYTVGDVTYRYLQVIVGYQSMIYNLTYTALPQNFEANRADVEAIIAAFAFR